MRILIFPLLLCLAMFNVSCANIYHEISPAYGPRAANNMAAQMDAQILARSNVYVEGVKLTKEQIAMRQRQLRQTITIVTTVPVNINNFDHTNALSRQISEEMARWFVDAGYRVQEIRKGTDIRIQEKHGEVILTRDREELLRTKASSVAILSGTYVISPEQVRYSMRLVHTAGTEVLAMSTATVPITPDVPPLLEENGDPVKVTPSVSTRLQ